MAYKSNFVASPNFSRGRPAGDPNVIVIHYWDDPKRKPRFDGVVSWLKNPRSQVSAHYVVEDGRVTQMVSEGDRAWHAGAAGNPRGIGIECNPRMTKGDLETLAELIAAIRTRRGNLPLKPHNSYMNTSCPGPYGKKLGWLSDRANQINRGSKKPAKPKKTTTKTTGALAVDGVFGVASTRRLQQVVGTKVTGLLGNQRKANRVYTPAFTSLRYAAWGSSSGVKGLQRKLGGLKVNGQLNKATVRRWQSRLGVTVDGYFGPTTARAAQRALNSGKVA